MKPILFANFFYATITLTSQTSVIVAFAPKLQPSCDSTKLVRRTQLYGLFDGMKEAFTAPALERSTLDANRETPIDRWMGWNVKSEDSTSSVSKGECVVLFLCLYVYLCVYLCVRERVRC